ncbi:transcription initiation factor TFIID subunit 1-like [Thalictrum thalictroides]|uniref:Transcription initiation factor TFIID subunit 1-like n=1 Tax=Thalictrum thalictroides TaxID=46969 RepID=A0A7J6VKC4_THATH|nr:transcription initiation factor TFIID subunit 1-like [Thalictrum thalictroides]
MPISGIKELGASSVASQSSGFITGVPIKKRKFLFVRPPSPPPQVPSESVSQQKEQSNSSSLPEGSPSKVSKSDSVVPSSSQEENKEHSADRKVNPVQSDSVTPGFNLEVAATDIVPSSRSEKCVRSTLVASNDTVACKIDKSTELQLAPNNALVQKVESEMRNEIEPLKNNKSNTLKELVDGELVLVKNESSVLDLAVRGSERNCEEDKLNQCSWNLALAERQNSSGGNTAHLQANRTHWDLNTMMETWEGSMNQSVIPLGVGGGEKRGVEHVMHFNKTVLTDSVGSLTASGKKRLGQGKDMSKLSNFPSCLDQPNTNEALLNLTLSTSSGIQSVFSLDPSHSSPKVDSRSDPSKTLNLSKNNFSAASHLKLACPRVVKPEPSDDNSQQNFEGLKDSPLNLVQCSIVKTEACVGYLQEHHKTSNIENLKLINHGAVKLEPVCEVNQATPMMTEENLRKSEIYSCNAALPFSCQLLTVAGVPDCTLALPITSHCMSCPASLKLSNCADEKTQSESLLSASGMPSTAEETQKTAQTDGAGTSASASNDGKKAVVSDDMYDIARIGLHAVDPVSFTIKTLDKLKPESQITTDVAESDEEKINLFDGMQDDCSSDTDDESDGNHGGVVVDSEDKPHGGEDDDYEDGEVREPLCLAIEVSAGLGNETECAHHEISDNREVSVSCFSYEDKDVNSGHVEDRDILIGDSGITKGSLSTGVLDDIQFSNRHDNCNGGPTHLQEALLIEMSATGTGVPQPINASERGLLDCMRREDELEGCEKNLFHDGSVSTSQGISPGNQGSIISQQENVKGTNPDETQFSVWCKTESLVKGAEATKDVNNKGNQSRIINLARAFSGPSPGRMRSFPGMFLPSGVERERFNDGMHSGEKLHPRGHSDDGSIDGRNKFERQRHQAPPVGSTGQEFIHGRGRPDKRFDSTHAAVMVARDGTVLGAGRKLMTDELANFRHPPSRRRSPGSRGRPVSHGVQIVRRSARDISPDGCINRTDPNVMGLRPEKKFMRGLPNDMMDNVFSRSQPQYQQADDPFIRGERRFSAVPRKGPLHNPRIRSRSPTRIRSPGSWSSPRRRSPDGFGRPDMIHRRSPPYYRMKRMRSPHQRPCYAEDIDGRRHGSPPYPRLSNEMREMGASGESDHPRSFIPNRSPSGRILPRGTRRFEMMDPRERIENDEYFTGSIHSDRFHEIGGDGGAEGRRICAERRRSFRPRYDSGEVEKFHFHVEGGSRPYRFSPEADAEFHERSNLREREFERRVKNRSGNAPRRARSVEEHEENYRHVEQGWHDSPFEDVSPTKSRRF